MTVSASEKGAELQSILGNDGTEYLWQGDPRYWSDRALNIFPYVARLTEGSYYLDGKLYHMNIHGFSPYCIFRLIQKTEDRMTFELSDDKNTYEQYPRHFSFQVIYTLNRNMLDITYHVENKDQKPLYFGFGGHPGFQVPLAKQLAFSDYYLRFDAQCTPTRIGFTESCFLSGQNAPYPLVEHQVLPLKHSLFDEDAIILKDMSHVITLSSDKDDRKITVSFPQMDYLGIWHWPNTDAPYVCIEPWSSLPSSQDKVAVLEEQEDLICLAANQHYWNTWSIMLHS